MPDEKVLQILIRAKDQASKVLKRVGAAAKKAMKVAAVAVAAFAAFSVAKFVEFEGQMNEVFTLMPDISADAMDEMTDQVKDFSREFGTLPNEVVPALYSAISAGVPADNVFDFLEVAQKAAVGGVTDLETAVDGISSVVNAYGSDVISASEASDIMFTGVRLGKTTFDELAASLFQVIPTAASLGVSFEDVTAAIAVMTAQGTPTSVATTQIRGLFVELSKSTTVVSQKFQELSGQSFAEFISTGGDVASALEILAEDAGPAVVQVMKDLQTEGSDLNKVFKEEAGESIEAFLAGGGTLTEALNMVADEAGFTGDAMTDMFGSVEAANAALAITSGGGDAFSAALEEMGASAGATEEAYATMEKGLGRSFDKIKAALVVTAIEFGEKLAPVVAKFAEWLIANMPKIQATVTGAFRVMGRWIRSGVKAWKDIKEALASFSGSAAAGNTVTWFQNIGDTIKRFVRAIPGIWEKFQPVIAGFREALAPALQELAPTWEALMNLFEAAKPILGVIAALFGAVLVGRIKMFLGILKGVIKMFRGMVKIITGIMNIIVGIFTLDLQRIQTGFLEVFSGIANIVSGFFSAIIDGVSGFVTGIIDFFKFLFDALVGGSIVPDMINAIIDWFVNLYDSALEWVMLLVNGVKDWFVKLKDGIIETATNAVNLVKDRFAELRDGVLSRVTALRDLVMGVIITLKDRILARITDLKDLLSSAWDTIKDAGASAFQWLSDTIDGIFSGIASFARGYVNTIIGVINLLIGGFNTVIGLASKIPIIGDKIAGFKIPEIPQLALGAIVTAPTLAVVGDNKREPEAVLPLSRLDSMLKNSGGGGPVFQRGAFDGAVFQVSPQTGSASDFFDSMQDVGLEVNGRKGLE